MIIMNKEQERLFRETLEKYGVKEERIDDAVNYVKDLVVEKLKREPHSQMEWDLEQGLLDVNKPQQLK